jgi:23S rRNA pseudouridine1911/1915/1917 synthase
MKQNKDHLFRDTEGRKQRLQTIYEDEDLLVLNKPAGLRVVPDRWNEELLNIYDLLNRGRSAAAKDAEQLIWIVHRLDAYTSGLLICARNPEAHKILNQSFAEGKIQKTYLAIVKGSPSPPAGKIDFPLLSTNQGRVRVNPQGKEALTLFKVAEQFRHFSLLEVFPQTGRMHQIRVHLQAIGHPLAVDPKYGGGNSLKISDLKKIRFQAEGEETSLISRLTLHAWKLKLTHPRLGQVLEFEAEIPKDFQALLKALRKWDRLRD